jgi:putative membrane protein
MDLSFWADVTKVLHIIAVISWMAGLLYLPRLYVYHAGTKRSSELSETLKVMEYRLLRYIMNPAMIVSWIAGLLTGYLQGFLGEPWFHAKFLLVVFLTATHMMLAKYRKEFAEDRSTRTDKFFRIINEVPTVLMVIIVVLVIFKPFS